MDAPYAINTSCPTEVAGAVKTIFGTVWGEGSFQLLDRVFGDIKNMFVGRYPGYQAIDMEYHDFEHTLQAALCMTHLLRGRNLSSDSPVLGVRYWELSVIAALLHDTGFLKEEGDDLGTGAKYTFVHESRSCDFARKYLQQLGLVEGEIEDVCSAIICTGPRGKVGEASFRNEEIRLMAFMLVTADYLAQMSASDYLEKLPRLYREFEESFEFNGIPLEDRPYQSERELLEKTPGFWHNFILPALENTMGGVYRYLSEGERSNPYLDAVDANLAELERRLEVGAV